MLEQKTAFDLARRLFDADWYLSQNPDVARAGLDPLLHYLERGAWERRDPNPLFDSHWYLSQFPEVAGSGINPLLHYLTEGAGLLHDPHPLIDTRTYLRICGRLPVGMTPLELFLASDKSALAGAYRSVEALQQTQQRFLDSVTVEVLRDDRRAPARWAVFLQCGRPSLHEQWLTSSSKPWHLIANFYDDSYYRAIHADMVLVQSQGTKFTAVHRLMEGRPDFFEPYDYVLFLDDDILVSEDQLTRLFELVQTLNLKLAQPALRHESAHTWPVVVEQAGSIGRYLNTVEIMMPVVSREALNLGAYLFGRTISGWGLDFALGQEVSRAFGRQQIAVIDSISLLHAKTIDIDQGSYYRMLRNAGLSALVEERVIGLAFGACGPIDLEKNTPMN
jgi:hypothetical protein